LVFRRDVAWTLTTLEVGGIALVTDSGFNGSVYRPVGGDWSGTGHGGESVLDWAVLRAGDTVSVHKESTMGPLVHRAAWEISRDRLLVRHEWDVPPGLPVPQAFYGFMFCLPNAAVFPEDEDDADGELHDVELPAVLRPEGQRLDVELIAGELAGCFVWDRDVDNKLYALPDWGEGTVGMEMELRWSRPRSAIPRRTGRSRWQPVPAPSGP